MVNVRRDDNRKTVQGCNDLSKYYAEQSLSYSNDSKDYAEIAQTSASNAQISAGSAEQSANTCTAVLNNTHFQTVYTDLESENSNIETVSDNIEDVNAVATNIESVNTNATNITAITTNATNITAIQNASSNAQTCIDNATIATQKATLASGSATSASNSATNANIWAEGTDEQVQALGGVHSSKTWAEISAQGQLQSDWSQTDSTKVDYIKNKPTVDQTFNSLSSNAQSGIAIARENFIRNTSKNQDSLTIGGTPITSGVQYGINIGVSTKATNLGTTGLGHFAEATNLESTAIGFYAKAGNVSSTAPYSTAIGYGARAYAKSAIQIGYGENSTDKSLNVGFYDTSPNSPTNYQLLDGTTGLIPDARLSSNIEKTTNKDIANGYCGLNASGKIDVANRIADSAITTSKIADNAINTSKLDTNITTTITNKADVDLTNVSTTSGLRKLVEVSPKSLFPSWYKVYDEYDPATGEFIGKWCEQGGICHGFTPVTLVKPYLDTNYTLLLSILGGGSTYGYYYGGTIISNSSFQAGSIATVANEHRWETKGYIS